MAEVVIDFITSLDGYGAAEGCPGGGAWRGLSTSPGWETNRKRLEYVPTVLTGPPGAKAGG